MCVCLRVFTCECYSKLLVINIYRITTQSLSLPKISSYVSSVDFPQEFLPDADISLSGQMTNISTDPGAKVAGQESDDHSDHKCDDDQCASHLPRDSHV